MDQRRADFRRCLFELDIAGLRRAQTEVKELACFPPAASDAEILLCAHQVRTAIAREGMHPWEFRRCAYSHSWLIERGFESKLADHLKPKAQRLYPIIVDAVGIAAKTLGNRSTPLNRAVEKAMSDVVLDFYADGKKEPEPIKKRMREVRFNIIKGW